MTRSATILGFDKPYDEGSRTIMPIHLRVDNFGPAIIELRAPRSALNLLWSMAPQYAGKEIDLTFEGTERVGGPIYLRGVKILRD